MDTKTMKRKVSKLTLKKESILKERQQEQKKGTAEKSENNEQNENSNSLPVNNYSKYKWFKSSN